MNERILVVDDEKAIADLVGIYLTKEGFDVQIAYSGADAAKAILEQEFVCTVGCHAARYRWI